MFFFRHPKPVVNWRPVAAQSVQVKAPTLPALTELTVRPSRPREGDQPDSPTAKRLAGS